MSKFRPGDLVEITEDVCFIPAGVYIYEGQKSGILRFSLLGGGVFGISEKFKNCLRKAKRAAASTLTPPEKFIRRYQSLLNKNAVTGESGISYCAVEHRSLRYLSED